MATPTDDTYTASSGADVYAGRSAPTSGLSGDVIELGDSLTDLAYSANGRRWGYPLTLHPPRRVYNAGVGGDTLDQISARIDDALAAAPTATIVDFRGGTNSIADASFETKYQGILDDLKTAGCKVICHSLPPNADNGSAVMALNTIIENLCDADPTNFFYIDDSAGLGDANYDAVDAYYGDAPTDVHPNGLGMYTQGVAMADDYETILVQTDPRITDGTDTYEQDTGSDQYVTNPLMTGTGGTPSGVTGTVPDDWSVNASGTGTTGTAEIVDADVDDANQTPWLRLNIASSGGDAHGMWFQTNLVHPAIAADETIVRFDCVAELRFNDLDCTNISSIGMKLQTGSGAVPQVGEALNTVGLGVINEHVVMRVSWPRTQGGVSLAAYDANTIRFLLSWGFTAADSGPLGSIDIRNVSVRGQAT